MINNNKKIFHIYTKIIHNSNLNNKIGQKNWLLLKILNTLTKKYLCLLLKRIKISNNTYKSPDCRLKISKLKCKI